MRHRLERHPVPEIHRLFCRPSAHQPLHLLPERAIGAVPDGRSLRVGVCRELAEHPEHRPRHAVVRRLGGDLHEVDDRVDPHPRRRIGDELSALALVPAHLEEALQGRLAQPLHELPHALLQRRGLTPLSRLEFVRDLQQVADDDLVIRLVPPTRVDGLRHHGGVRGLGVLAIDGLREFVGEGRAREADPEGRGPAPRAVAAHLVLAPLVTLLPDELELREGHREEPHVGPLREHLRPFETKRLRESTDVGGDQLQQVAQLLLLDPTAELHGPQRVLVESTGQLPEHRVGRLGGHPFDDELLPCHADGDGGTVREQFLQSMQEGERHLVQHRVPGRIDGALLEPDRQLDQELRELRR